MTSIIARGGSLEWRMMRQPQKPQSAPRKPKPSPQEKRHLDELLDEALDETFPASDPPAMLEPVPDAERSDEKESR
jgi:hypothetical protein